MIFKNFIAQTVEFQNINSWNEVSIGFIMAIILAIIQAIGMWRQKNKVGSGKNEKTFLSLVLFSALFLYYIDYGIYGIYKHSLTIIISNFFLGLFFIPIIVKIIKYKIKGNGFSKLELLISPFLLFIVPGMIIFTDKDLFLTILLFILGLSLIPQGLEFIKRKNDIKEKNDFEPLFVFTILLNNIVWLIFGLEIHSSALIWSSIPTIIITGIALALYYLFKLNRKKSV